MPDSSELRTALLGRDTNKSLLAFGLATVLLLGVYLLGAIGEGQGWIFEFGQLLPQFVLVVFVVGGAVAAGNAYWNDGLVLSWFLVFGPVLAWLWIVWVQGAVSFEIAIVPVAFASLAALVAGTLGYVVGRVINGRTDSESWYEPTGWLVRVLVGQVPARTVGWWALAGGLFVLASVLFYTTDPLLPLPIVGVSLIALFIPVGALAADLATGVVAVLAWMGLAAWPAYRREGLLVSWGLLFAPGFGAMLIHYAVGDRSGGGPWFDAVVALLYASSIALLLGTGGYLLGSGLRWIADRNRPSAVKPDTGT